MLQYSSHAAPVNAPAEQGIQAQRQRQLWHPEYDNRLRSDDMLF
jgi:hypothetical protein